MKNTKNKYIVLALLINLGLGLNTAEASLFDKLKDAGKKAAEASKVIYEKAKETAESTLEYTKEQLEQIEKERAENKNKNKSNTDQKNNDTTPVEDRSITEKKEEKKEEKKAEKLEDISKDSQITIISQGGYQQSDSSSNDGERDSNSDSESLGSITLINENPPKKENKPSNTKVVENDDYNQEAFPWKKNRNTTPSRTNTTNNSLIVIEGKVRDTTRWVLIEIIKDSKRQQVIVEPSYGKFTTDIIGLQSGAGDYKVQIAESSSHSKLDSYTVITTKTITNNDYSDTSFLLPSPEIQSTNQEILELAKDIAGHARTQREAVELINEWIIDNLEYDWQAFRSGSYKTDEHDALTILEKRLAVCEGYSRLFAALTRAAGIKTKFIHGLGYTAGVWGGHAWNEVFIEGKWLSVDSTWNDSIYRKKYLMIENAQFSKDHRKENELAY